MKIDSGFQMPRALRFTLPCVVLAGLLVGSQLTLPACGQTCAGCAVSETLAAEPVSTGEWSFSKEVNEVNVLFVAMQGGRFIGDLSPNDVTVLDDRKPPAAILGFRTERELPLRVGLVIDTSSSVTSRFRFEQQGAGAFLHQALTSERDQAFVMGFSDEPRMAQDFVNDPKALSQAVQGLTIGGGTALYDAVAAGCQRLLESSDGEMVARVLVILSDGQNNSGKTSLNAAIDMAQQAQVVVYTVSTNYQYQTDEQDWDADEGNKNLRRLAEETGGRMFKPPAAKEVGKAFAKVAEELRSRYAIAYRPADFRADGHYRKITIVAHRMGENLKVRARKGYYAKLVSLANNRPLQP